MVHRLAVIGLGDMGSAHARGFDQLENCHVVATVDLNPSGVPQHATEWRHGLPRHYTNYREMLEREKPEAVVVAVPDLLHREVSEAVLHAGCDLLLEKPVATTLADTDAIIALAAEKNKLLQIGLVYRYSNFYRRMAELGAQPGHEVTLMWCKELRQPFPQRPWFYSQHATGGTIVEKDCHHFDIFNWVIGSRAVRVFATGGQHRWKSGSEIACNYCPDPPRVIEQIDTVDHALVTVDYENGARACLILCMYLTPQNVMPEGLEIGAIARSGRQICAYGDSRMGVGGIGEPFTWETIDMKGDNDGLGHIGCQEQRRDFLRCLDERRTPLADGKVGRDSLAIALAAEQSIREMRPIDL
ncbi:gfo/Idh/MocA family oxidoreductase [bacterium]|nr:gfo/Idh/MocA family oxidoreductase [bacterium]